MIGSSQHRNDIESRKMISSKSRLGWLYLIIIFHEQERMVKLYGPSFSSIVLDIFRYSYFDLDSFDSFWFNLDTKIMYRKDRTHHFYDLKYKAHQIS